MVVVVVVVVVYVVIVVVVIVVVVPGQAVRFLIYVLHSAVNVATNL